MDTAVIHGLTGKYFSFIANTKLKQLLAWRSLHYHQDGTLSTVVWYSYPEVLYDCQAGRDVHFYVIVILHLGFMISSTALKFPSVRTQNSFPVRTTTAGDGNESGNRVKLESNCPRAVASCVATPFGSRYEVHYTAFSQQPSC